ncbi:hypothetical protein [Erythrobacter sp. F6033]|uniref:hypothetical protein n=1 Tax=Erythrobacter sp. F6033 TaxID=2926401 RepID=UPI001FF69121|nr:hypothetical protein [Erythrobacter sp. F6033]MCK0127959.1 hypothetical protein [Erythrobacter sp. F6033]
MSKITPYHNIDLIQQHCEVHSAVGGFYNVETIQPYFEEVNAACVPLLKARAPIYALVDFTDFVPQDRETGDAIRDHLLTSQKFGLKRIAIMGASPLTTLQYKRLSDGLKVEFFDSKPAAIAWLREDR